MNKKFVYQVGKNKKVKKVLRILFNLIWMKDFYNTFFFSKIKRFWPSVFLLPVLEKRRQHVAWIVFPVHLVTTFFIVVLVVLF